MSGNLPGTTVLSGLSLLDGLSASTLSLLNGLSANTIVASSTLSVGGAATFSNSVAIGAGSAIAYASVGTCSIVTITATGNKSVTTTVAISGLTVGDLFTIKPAGASGVSADVVVNGYCSAAGTATVLFSNVSGTTAVVAGPATYVYSILRP